MKHPATLLLVLLPATASGQDKPPAKPAEVEAPLAPMSCTAKVPAAICKDVSDEFSFYHQAKAMRQVEIIVADEEEFKQEHDRLWARFQNQVDTAIKVNGAMTAAWVAATNRKPVAPSLMGDHILFVLGDGKIRLITKVVISSELFRGLNPKGDYDPTLVGTYELYIVGFVEAWLWGTVMNSAGG